MRTPATLASSKITFLPSMIMIAQWLILFACSILICEAFVVSTAADHILCRYADRKALFHQSHDDDNLTFDEATLPPWASNLKPPRQTDIVLEILFLDNDDFVSVELENEDATPETFCATVVYEDREEASQPRYFGEPRMGTIEPNGGLQEVTVMPIFDEDSGDDSPYVHQGNAWLVVSTEKGQWYYKLEPFQGTSATGG